MMLMIFIRIKFVNLETSLNSTHNSVQFIKLTKISLDKCSNRLFKHMLLKDAFHKNRFNLYLLLSKDNQPLRK